MQTFQTSGRLGDIVYQLYTIKAMGGGDIIIDLEHHKEPPEKWNWHMAESIMPLLSYQTYIDSIFMSLEPGGRPPWKYPDEPIYDFDMVDAERAPMDPPSFPEWHGRNWPGNIHIAKRYAHHFGVAWKPGSIWLDAPKTKEVDIVIHAPHRRVTDYRSLAEAIQRLDMAGHGIAIIDIENEWPEEYRLQPKDMLEAADWINSAKVFLGAVSSCHAIAEALGKPRLVQQAPDCDNVNSTHVLNGLNARQIVELVERYL